MSRLRETVLRGIVVVPLVLGVISAVVWKGLHHNREKSPSVLLFVMDALRADVLGCMGGEARTPNIDALAARGTLFAKAYSTTTWTYGSSTSLLTGSWEEAYRFGALQHGKLTLPEYHVPNDAKLLPELLAERGYRLWMTIEVDLALRSNAFQGFRSYPTRDQLPERDRLSIQDQLRPLEGHKVDDREYNAIYQLARPENGPYLSVVWIKDPHAPYDSSPPSPQPASWSLPHPPEYYRALQPGPFDRSEPLVLDDEELRYLRSLYVADVESADARIGMFLKALELSGRSANTVVVLLADHGEAFGERGLYEHGGPPYQVLIHVPLIIYDPRLTGGRVVTDAVSLIDVMPTLSDLLGMPRSPEMQGRSVVPLMRGEVLDPRPIYCSSRVLVEHHDVLIEDHYALHCADGQGPTAMYDIASDPYEKTNVLAQQPQRAVRMMQTMQPIRDDLDRRRRRNIERSRADPPVDVQTLEALRALGYIQ